MANFTNFTGGGDVIATGTNAGRQFKTVLVEMGSSVNDVGSYLKIQEVSETNVDTSDVDYNANFSTTLYYITE